MDEFEIIDKIGNGSFGDVFKAINKTNNNVIAIKRFKFQDYYSEKEIQKILIEIESLKQTQSEHVVEYYDSWYDGRYHHIAMELCDDSLKSIIQLKPEIFGRELGEPMNIFEYFISGVIFKQLLESVQYLHELKPQIIHRDLKPDNILITSNVKNGRFVKLCDFGLATVHDKTIHYMTKFKHTADVGDMRYMAPEVSQRKKYGHKSDIYSLSLIGCELFNNIDLSMSDYDSRAYTKVWVSYGQ
ncbi:unnamed protein product, partial [Oppiella nova]